MAYDFFEEAKKAVEKRKKASENMEIIKKITRFESGAMSIELNRFVETQEDWKQFEKEFLERDEMIW